jgi:hypothetical protein
MSGRTFGLLKGQRDRSRRLRRGHRLSHVARAVLAGPSRPRIRRVLSLSCVLPGRIRLIRAADFR